MESATRRLFVMMAFALLALTTVAHAASPRAATTPARSAKQAKALPQENPLRKADEATRRQALTEAWTTFQRSCRPCHGSSGAGDGPYAAFFPRRASDLRRAGKAIATDAVRFQRIHDGAAGLPERPWESSMPAYGTDLDERQIWGLVSLAEVLGEHESGVDPGATAADVYADRCQVCHGATGKGDGPLATELWPRPRDFVRASYRFRSTTLGSAPLDSDLMGSIAQGLGSTSMGSFLPIGSQHIEDLAAHLVTYAPERFKGEPETVMMSPVPAIPSSELANRGRKVYDDAGCAECHGAAGRGNGPAAATLKTDEGDPVMPTDLTRRYLTKHSIGQNDLFRTVSTGLNGTPMRGYPEISPEDRWALIFYLDRIGRGRPRFPAAVFARTVTDALPVDPAAALWSTIPATSVPLGPQMEVPPYWAEPSIDFIEVAVAATQRQVAFLLTWNDRTKDVQSDDAGGTRTVAEVRARYGAWRLPDQVAIELPTALTPELPHPLLGSAERTVERWRWSADRAGAVVERASGIQAPIVPRPEATVKAAATYADGQWRVVLVGDLPEKVPDTLPVAIQLWDGSTGETGNWLAFSAWMPVTLR